MATIESPHRPKPPPDSWRHYQLLLILATVVLVLDQATKLWIVHLSGLILGAYPPFGGIEVIPGVFNLVYAVNPGAAWGILAGYSWLFLCIAGAALVGLVVYRRALELARRPYSIAFGLIVGGIIGNVIDRIAYGHVIDFLDVDLQFYRWPTFNVADSAILLGVSWMIVFSQFFDRPPSLPLSPPSSP